MDQDLLHEILAGMPLPTLLLGADERISAANAAAQVLFGVENGPARNSLVGRHHAFVLRQPEVLRAIAEAAATGRMVEARHVTPGPSHEVIHRFTAAPVGQGVLCTFQDISDREQMDVMRRDFVANVSHELRTPLTAMLAFIETLRGAAREDPAARDRFLVIMQAEAERMVRIVRDLLHLSKVEAQERQRPTERHDITRLITAAVHTLRPLAEAAQVRLVLDGVDHPIEILADADQITQAATNLIENAIKYGGPGKEVRVSLEHQDTARGPKVVLAVKDQGEGIDTFHIPRLTERFYRIDGHRSRMNGGTGLGLAIVKHIAHRHRGRLQIESTPGLGSTFAIVLPAN